MTRGRAATTDPFDLGAVNRSDELFEALSSRRPCDDDPAVHLLAALAADVDAGAPPLPPRVTCTSGGRRRSVAAVLTFGVAVTILTSAGAAVAVGGDSGGHSAGRGRPAVSERSNSNVHREAASGEGQSAAPGDPSTARDSRDVILPVDHPKTTSGEDSGRLPSAPPGLPDLPGGPPAGRPPAPPGQPPCGTPPGGTPPHPSHGYTAPAPSPLPACGGGHGDDGHDHPGGGENCGPGGGEHLPKPKTGDHDPLNLPSTPCGDQPNRPAPTR